MKELSQQAKNLLASMAQACKNIIAVSAPIANASDFDNKDTIADNIYMNLVIISENYAKTDDDIKQLFAAINWPEIKRYIDMIIPDYKSAENRVLFYVSKALIPRVNDMIDKLFQKTE